MNCDWRFPTVISLGLQYRAAQASERIVSDDFPLQTHHNSTPRGVHSRTQLKNHLQLVRKTRVRNYTCADHNSEQVVTYNSFGTITCEAHKSERIVSCGAAITSLTNHRDIAKIAMPRGAHFRANCKWISSILSKCAEITYNWFGKHVLQFVLK